MDEDQLPSYILQTSASYYNLKIKKWNHGILILEEDKLQFYENEMKDDNLILDLTLDDITSIQRKNSSFIFGSVVIMSGCVAHWFASFYNRDSIFNVLQLFWKHYVYSGKYSQSKLQIAKEGKTELGKELLQLAQESEKTLVATSLMLNHQGKQLDHAAEVMDKISSDLTIAEKLIGLMTWTLGLNQNQYSNLKKEGKIIKRKANQYPIVYCFVKTNDDKKIWCNGILQNEDNELKIFDDKFRHIENFNNDNVEYIKIASSWELQICYRKENILDVAIKCPSLSDLQIPLINLFPDKLKFINNVLPWNNSTNASCSTVVQNLNYEETNKQIKKTMTRAELEELNATVSQLKSLAVEIGLEQSNHIEKIDSMLQYVNNTDIRIKQDVKNIKKLM